MFRRMHLEDISDRGLMHDIDYNSKRNELINFDKIQNIFDEEIKELDYYNDFDYCQHVNSSELNIFLYQIFESF